MSNETPHDEHLTELLEQSVRGNLMCQGAMIKMEAIKPFTDYNPGISQQFRQHFLEKFANKEALPLYVYEKDGKFIMSDDYRTYFLYKEMNAEEVPCIVVGEITDTKNVTKVGKPFHYGKHTPEFFVETDSSV